MMEKPFTLFISAQTVVTHVLWGICQGKDEISLLQHREKIESNLHELTLSTSILSSIKKHLHLLEQAYNDAFDWLRIYKDKIESLKNNEIDILLDEQYRFSNFITLLGKFDDTAWVNQFVDDPQRKIIDRFYFACFYCMEHKIQPLWREAQKNHHFRCSYSKEPDLVKFWIPLVSGNLVELDNFHYSTIYFRCKFALKNGYEKALHYFLGKLTEPSRRSMCVLFCANIFLHKARAIVKYPKCLLYIVSHLDSDMLTGFLQLNFHSNGYVSFWHNYLNPQLISSIPVEIQLYQNELPETAYAHFVMNLVLKMTKIKNGLYQEIFQTIWKIGSTNNKICFLEHYRGVLWILFRSKDFVCSRCLLKDVSLEERKSFLFESMEELLFENASFRSDQHAICNYLLLFLTDLQEYNSSASKLTPFHSDSLNLIKEIQEKLLSMQCSQGKANLETVLPVVEKLILDINNFFKASKQKRADNELESGIWKTQKNKV